ncbi:glycine--tRNA ligase [Patescibacteria group bacterium]|nr:glycine--tRNA ligase [Patescibacteria group bacterium]
MEKVVSLCKRRGFIFPGSEIYGGLANSWDYGPLGVELKNNIKQEWWKRFVHQRTDVVGIDSALVMNPKVWEASGHLSNFSDPLVECKKCHNRFRADQIEGKDCPDCGGELTKPQQFNLMFKTFIGPAEEEANVAFFRPETAQGMFVDFKNVLETTRRRLPFGIAQVGKSFRNEITPGNFIFRTREFEQMEIEYFIEAKDWEKYFDHWLGEMKQWLTDLGVAKEKLHFDDIPDGERAHYSKRTVDIEYDFPFGKKELYGLAYRTDFDLKNHMDKSGEDLRYTDPVSGEKFLPHVIEPTWGVDRSVLVALLEAYHEENIESGTPQEKALLKKQGKLPTTPAAKALASAKGEAETRVVLKFPKWLAPVKVAILPLSKKENLSAKAKEIYAMLAKDFVCEYDETQSIGKRYRRQDEIGTPYCVTVDFATLGEEGDEQKDTVTVRDRDTMTQERIALADLSEYLRKKLS